MGQLVFDNPEVLYLLLCLIPAIVWYVLRQKDQNATLQLSTIRGLEKVGNSWKTHFRHIPFVLKSLAFALIIFAIARPQSTENWENTTTEGIDIIIALDISSSMLARDFQPDRITAAKAMGMQFITGRPNDRIGLVIFSGESFTQCPLTSDHAALINLMKEVQSGLIEDGTAIGNGLGTAISRLKESKAKSRVVILLTDGVNNRGEIAPLTAAEIAHTYGIRVYTVGVGSMGMAPYPMQTPFGIRMQDMEVQIDEPMLKEISKMTDGKYFRATSNRKLEEVYSAIDKLEKSKVDIKTLSKKEEQFFPFALAALLLIALDFIVKVTILRTIP
ncbi:vWA domain-containing protein [Williamwhitmania taraxaci]|uniref:Ca-activated chloride channel family protein n=1 Tax=Williamwhitmania taraxaci TaxID=1640674 RepID=A0A1G6HVE0_9BACT|nr:VWA domain-containing protein [Williamwhitmania taraxaci]SDB98113.1 Ca-activated chloride channel family protein [Williamwhitmania taraxaci]